MKDSRKEFIKQGHKAACSEWKEKIEKEFPELFKEDALVVGKWYKTNFYDCNHLINITELTFNDLFKGSISQKHYGFDDGVFKSQDMWNNTEMTKSLIPATDREVKKALIKEAKKIGFKEGACFIPTNGIKVVQMASEDRWSLTSEGKLLFCNYSVFENGVWAIIIKQTITKEQAEKELGKTILN
jgi:hypothetical protein